MFDPGGVEFVSGSLPWVAPTAIQVEPRCGFKKRPGSDALQRGSRLAAAEELGGGSETQGNALSRE
jgi:hypothetical protein